LTDLQITQLSSGLTVATERVPGALSVATGVWVAVGARDEPDSLSGVTHFLEHLLFKGTERLSAIDISRTIDRFGGDINAFTTKEYTAYYCRLPARHAAVGIDLLGDVLTAPALRDAELEIERQVILEEIAMDDDSPDDVAHRVFGEEMFPDHPLGRDTAGAPDTVEIITTADVRQFFEQRYTAGSMVVSVAGAATHAELLGMVERSFASVSPGVSETVRSAPTSIGTGRSVADDTEQVHLVVGGRSLARADPDREALDVVNHVLGGGLSSRLFDEIREKRGLVYSVFSGLASYSDVGAYAISAGTQPKHAAEVLELIQVELRRLARDGITSDELDVARGYLTGSFELGLEDTASRMARNGGLLCTRGSIVAVDEQVRRWNAVELDDTQRVIERVFSAEPVVVTVGPRS
jgi:predicted Zn-dependent peptidase